MTAKIDSEFTVSGFYFSRFIRLSCVLIVAPVAISIFTGIGLMEGRPDYDYLSIAGPVLVGAMLLAVLTSIKQEIGIHSDGLKIKFTVLGIPFRKNIDMKSIHTTELRKTSEQAFVRIKLRSKTINLAILNDEQAIELKKRIDSARGKLSGFSEPTAVSLDQINAKNDFNIGHVTGLLIMTFAFLMLAIGGPMISDKSDLATRASLSFLPPLGSCSILLGIYLATIFFYTRTKHEVTWDDRTVFFKTTSLKRDLNFHIPRESLLDVYVASRLRPGLSQLTGRWPSLCLVLIRKGSEQRFAWAACPVDLKSIENRLSEELVLDEVTKGLRYDHGLQGRIVKRTV